VARLAITSFAFMFVEVPEPVWKTSRTNSSSRSPDATCSEAPRIASAIHGSRRPSSSFARAAAHLMRPSAWINRRGNRMPEIGKFSTAR
jgi:hypothetical protein